MKRAVFSILCAVLLTGCTDNITHSEPVTSAVQTSDATLQTSSVKEQPGAPAEPVDTVTPPTEKDRLLQLIRDDITEDEPDASPNLAVIFFEDFDGDGVRDLIAADGGMEIYDGEAYYYGNLWQVTEGGNYAHWMRAGDGSSSMTGFRRLTAGDDELISFELYSDTSEYNTTELWEYTRWFTRVYVDGTAQLHITQTNDCEFTAFSTGYGANTDGTGRIYLPYELHYNSARGYMEPYLLREMTYDDFIGYCDGYGQSILDMIAADGGEDIAYYLSENNKLVINYTVGEKLRYVRGEWQDGTLRLDTDEDNLGNYPVDITLEQQRLERLILDSIPEEQKLPDGEIVYSLFGDLDGDGTEEIVSAYANADRTNDLWCYVWFASRDTVEFIGSGAVGRTMTTPDGTFLYFPRVGPWGTTYELLYIHNSRIYNAMPDGGMNYIYYDEENGCYLAGQSGFYYDEASDTTESFIWDIYMSFDHESKKLIVTDTIETKTTIYH